MPESKYPYTYLAFVTPDEHEGELLLVKRQLIQKWTGGRPCNPIIPPWAGQWGLICARAQAPQPIARTAYEAMLAQTGIQLDDPLAAQRYHIIATATRTLQDAAYNPIPVLYVICQADGLRALQTDVQSNIENLKVDDGVLEDTALKRLSEAQTLLGPVAPPPGGWQPYIIAHYYDGTPPRLNPPIDAQTQSLTARSAKPPVGFQLVLDHPPDGHAAPPSPPLPPSTSIATTVTIVNTRHI